MASITITDLDEETARRLRIRAAERGVTMEEEARAILKREGGPETSKRTYPSTKAWVDEIVARFQEVGGVELELPHRSKNRPPVDFSEW